MTAKRAVGTAEVVNVAVLECACPELSAPATKKESAIRCDENSGKHNREREGPTMREDTSLCNRHQD